jgi:sporulation protein YlmC with PRC-barrel domain
VRTLSSVLGRKVVTESGLSLGRCHDVRAELTPSKLELTHLCVGPGGILDRLGIGSRPHHAEVAWSAIVRFEANRIVVRDPS